MIVRPVPGLTIIRPDTNQPLVAGGADVPDQDWCLRRLRDGDVLLGYAVTIPATAFTVSASLSSAPVGSAVTLTVTPAGGIWPIGTTLTLATTGLTGTASAPVSLSGSAAASLSYTGTTAGSGTLAVTASPAMTNSTGPVALTVTTRGHDPDADPACPGTFATVATTGAYADLTGKPDLSIYRTAAQVTATVQAVVGAVPAALQADESAAAALTTLVATKQTAAQVASAIAAAAPGAATTTTPGLVTLAPDPVAFHGLAGHR